MATGSGGHGPGVRMFLEAYEASTDMDVAAIVRAHPGEALAVAGAIREAAEDREAAARIRMWRARGRALGEAGEDASLGMLLRDYRRGAELTTTALSELVRERGEQLHHMAIGRLEENRASITNVPEAVWPVLVDVLGIDRHLLFVSIGDTAAAANPSSPGFTRMERGATAADRERALGEADGGGGADGGSLDDYLERVRAALDLPRVTR